MRAFFRFRGIWLPKEKGDKIPSFPFIAGKYTFRFGKGFSAEGRVEGENYVFPLKESFS
jgi:hypothetical protein